jgi:peptide/nickel transport system substrate-binding protein
MRVTRLAAALSLVLTVSLACTSEVTCGDRCGTAVVVTAGEAGTLFPPSANTNIELGLVDLIFQKLANIGPSLNTLGDSGFVPGLASSWRFTDPTRIRFTLNRAARWHDGTPVTADDVVFSFDVYRDSLVNAASRSRIDRIAAVAAPDERTVVITFSEQYPEQLFDAVYHVRILPRHLLDSVPRDRLISHRFGRQPVGSGPYRFVQWAAGQFVELTADSAFSLGRPGIPRIIWRFTPEPNTALTQLLAGDADILEFVGGPENVRRVQQADHLNAIAYPTLYYSYIAFNLRDPEALAQPHPLFADRRLRRALAMAVDRESIVRAVLGDLGTVAAGPLTERFAIWSDTIPQLPYDVSRARRILSELGWRDRDGDGVLDQGSQRLSFELLVPATSTPRVRSAQIVQDQLRRVGVAMRIMQLDFETMLGRADEGRFDAVYGAYGGDPSPASIAEVWTANAVGSFNYGRYVNPSVDRLIASAMSASDGAVARVLWHRAIAEINADAPAIFVYASRFTAGVHRRFENVRFRSDQWTTTLWEWRIAPTQLIDRDRFGTN